MRVNPSRRQLVRWTGAAALVPWLASCGGGGGNAGAFAVPSASSETRAREADYVKAVEALMSTYHVPGVLAGVRVDGAVPWTRAFGLADVARATPLSLSSSFPLRSVTKSFTVTAFLQLVRLGQLGIDDKIARYVAGVPNGSLISLADLAGNQSGLVDYSMQPGFIEVFVKDLLHVWTPQELVAFSFAVPPSFLPGERYEYSNTNTVLLGMVIEAVTGLPLGDVLAAQIFRPLGLTGTHYPSSATLPSPAPTGYAVDIATGAIDDQPLVSPTSLAGSGAMASTLADLIAWGDALGSGALIGSPLQTVRKSRARSVTNGPEYDRYGLGIGQIGNWWGHTGSGIGFQVGTMYLERAVRRSRSWSMRRPLAAGTTSTLRKSCLRNWLRWLRRPDVRRSGRVGDQGEPDGSSVDTVVAVENVVRAFGAIARASRASSSGAMCFYRTRS